MNGAAARLGQKGDLIIIISYAQMEPAEISADYEPTVVHVDHVNRIDSLTHGEVVTV